MYLGSGWVGETWRGLRDELTMAPLFGERWGGLPARALAWPVVAVTAGTFLGGAVVALFRWPLPAGRAGSTVLLVAGAVVLAVCLTAGCVGAGLRRTGWAHRGLLACLRRG